MTNPLWKFGSFSQALLITFILSGCFRSLDPFGLRDDQDEVRYEELTIVKEWTIDIKELSGACLRSHESQQSLFLVGDANYVIGTHQPQSNLVEIDSFETHSVRSWPEQDEASPSQWEAIACDRERLFILNENPGRIDIVTRQWEHVGRILLKEAGGNPPGWEDANHRGEGLLLMTNGHVLVLKEQEPGLLIEYGPQDDDPIGVETDKLIGSNQSFQLPEHSLVEYKPLHYWRFNTQARREFRDFSDMTIGPDGRIYVLSDQRRRLARLEGRLKLDEEFADFKDSQFYALPEGIHKPEGIAIDSEFRPFVVSDESDTNGPNAFLLSPITP